MKISWAVGTSPLLHERREESLFALYHENSKLFPELAAEQAGRFRASPFELYLTSRGFRQFRGAPRTPLPEGAGSPDALSEVLARRRSRRDLVGSLSFEVLAIILQQSLGPTAVVENAEFGLSQALRAWPSAGGLYPLDAYLIAAKVAGLPPGLYHYNVVRAALELLPARSPDLVLRDGFFWQDFVSTAAAALLFVAVFERTTAKYGERGYRLVLLDAGHAAQNVLLSAEQAGVNATAVAGFSDDALARDLGIDGIAEAVVHSVVLGTPHD